jgi:hypothetical protein
MRDGRARLAAAPDALPSLDVARLLADTDPWEAWLTSGTPPVDAMPPRLAARGAR